MKLHMFSNNGDHYDVGKMMFGNEKWKGDGMKSFYWIIKFKWMDYSRKWHWTNEASTMLNYWRNTWLLKITKPLKMYPPRGLLLQLKLLKVKYLAEKVDLIYTGASVVIRENLLIWRLLMQKKIQKKIIYWI
jgi:hypothetical protein